ncbi:MAG: vanadium-dependent haloperoxidase [Phycisphaerae bacterium]
MCRLNATAGVVLVIAGIVHAGPAAPSKVPPGYIEHRAANPQASAAYRWVDILLEVTGREVDKVGARPTIISRQMAIPLTAMYDAWAAYDERAVGLCLGGKLRRPAKERTLANKERAIAYAMHTALVDGFPQDRAWLDAQMRQMGHDPAAASSDLTTPIGIGRHVAELVLESRRHDGANERGDEVGSNGKPYSDYTFYEPRNPIDRIVEPDRWQPLPFSDGKGGHFYPGFLTPHWYRVRPCMLERSDQFRSAPYPKVGSDALKREVDECIEFNATLSLEQKAIVEFMRDGPRSTGQSGHWLQFAQDVSRRDHFDLDRDVKLFFAIGNTAFDAFIACWESKRFYDSARPWTLVRHLYRGQTVNGYLGPWKGVGKIPAEQWHPYSPDTFVTPPFPGYPSGHSTVSGACSKMLELFTGSDEYGIYERHVAGKWTEADCDTKLMQARDGKPPADTPDSAEVILLMPTFTATAEMAGLSRIMGGYHIRADNVAGLKMGREVARYSWPKYQAYFNGTAAAR